MNIHSRPSASLSLTKLDPSKPALTVLDREVIAIRAGTQFAHRVFEYDTLVGEPAGGYEPGADYAVTVTDGIPRAVKLTSIPTDPAILGGFHFMPGGLATARSGGDTIPAIHPHSSWDQAFRPACPDPRGAAFVNVPGYGPAWYDIYLLCRDHLKRGTSACGVEIADGDSPPQKLDGKGHFAKLDYDTAVAVMKHHGKALMSYDEFRFLAHGVTERTARARDPEVTGLDAPRTSRFLFQATGNVWVWGHDGDPDDPRPSIFGGSWFSGSDAGSRCAYLGHWPENSDVFLGARGRSDHLQLD